MLSCLDTIEILCIFIICVWTQTSVYVHLDFCFGVSHFSFKAINRKNKYHIALMKCNVWPIQGVKGPWAVYQ